MLNEIQYLFLTHFGVLIPNTVKLRLKDTTPVFLWDKLQLLLQFSAYCHAWIIQKTIFMPNPDFKVRIEASDRNQNANMTCLTTSKCLFIDIILSIWTFADCKLNYQFEYFFFVIKAETFVLRADTHNLKNLKKKKPVQSGKFLLYFWTHYQIRQC